MDGMPADCFHAVTTALGTRAASITLSIGREFNRLLLKYRTSSDFWAGDVRLLETHFCKPDAEMRLLGTEI
jgi:hypothetical protein